MKITLKPQEEHWRQEIAERLKTARNALAGLRADHDVSKLIVDAGERAHKLHMSLKRREIEPKHHAYMVKNRGKQPDDPEFYKHLHPIEDLLKFLDDPHANDDPKDQTLDEEFKFEVYSRRRGHRDTYTLKRTWDGWEVHHMAIGGPCDKGGRPFLFQNFRQDSIQFPSGLDGYMEWLWNQAREQGLSKSEVERALRQLADWVSLTEEKAPSGGVWEGS